MFRDLRSSFASFAGTKGLRGHCQHVSGVPALVVFDPQALSLVGRVSVLFWTQHPRHENGEGQKCLSLGGRTFELPSNSEHFDRGGGYKRVTIHHSGGRGGGGKAGSSGGKFCVLGTDQQNCPLDMGSCPSVTLTVVQRFISF